MMGERFLHANARTRESVRSGGGRVQGAETPNAAVLLSRTCAAGVAEEGFPWSTKYPREAIITDGADRSRSNIVIATFAAYNSQEALFRHVLDALGAQRLISRSLLHRLPLLYWIPHGHLSQTS